MKKTLIFGINRFAELLSEYMEEDGIPVAGFLVDKKYKPDQEMFCGKPIYITEHMEQKVPADNYNVILALGYHKMNTIRQMKYLELKEKGYEILYLTDNVDEFVMQALGTYKEKKFKNISQGDLDLASEEEKKELETKEFTAKAGGGAVEVTVTGKKEITKVKLSQEVVDPDDVEMLEDLVMAATNEALRMAEDANAEIMNKMTGGLGLGGGLPF